MNPSLIILIASFLVLGVIALGTLIWALGHTVEGSQDSTGFHFDKSAKS